MTARRHHFVTCCIGAATLALVIASAAQGAAA
jgi:hypothetical protein